jgi:hypothetical protein
MQGKKLKHQNPKALTLAKKLECLNVKVLNQIQKVKTSKG